MLDFLNITLTGSTLSVNSNITIRAIFLVKSGKAEKAFEEREAPMPEPGPLEMRIKVRAFGLNFADVMARMGLYPEAPKKPAILGYDVVGYVDAIGSEVHSELKEGDHVVALTRFGGYATHVCTDYRGVVAIDEDVHVAEATALTTQGGTAYYMAHEMVHVFQGDHVLIHAAAGGVGSILCQMLHHQGAIVYGTAGTDEKVAYVKSLGVQYPINYRKASFDTAIKELLSDQNALGLDVVFDAIGGGSAKKGFKLLGAGGRIVLFGAAALTSASNIFSKLGVLMGFGLYSPLGFMTPAKGMIGVNMLRIADDKPEVLKRVLSGTVDLFQKGVIRPKVGGVYPVADIAKAHDDLGSRKTMGKVAITW